VPELPDIVVYIEALQRKVQGRPLEAVRLASPFLLRSVDPPPAAAHGRVVSAVRRILGVLGLKPDVGSSRVVTGKQS